MTNDAKTDRTQTEPFTEADECSCAVCQCVAEPKAPLVLLEPDASRGIQETDVRPTNIVTALICAAISGFFVGVLFAKGCM